MSGARKRLMGLAALPVAVVAVLAAAPQAMAGSGSACGTDTQSVDRCLRFSFNSNEQGSQTYVWGNIPNLASYKFITLGGGQGYSLKNHAASAANFSNTSTTIYYNSNYGGSCDTLTYYAIAEKLHYTYNNDASVKFNYGKSSCYQF
ncbi:peptidase inhibitor family I36 protein [Streptomyces sp. CA-111067]|uniref:peptidase inhibitor family I36 protein n=1 Tax=Streptomyces sp. CA-111067 TaxID=3240046 RepID=UPI003D96C523